MRFSLTAGIAVVLVLSGCASDDREPDVTTDPDAVTLVPDTLPPPGEMLPDTLATEEALRPAQQDALRERANGAPPDGLPNGGFQGTAGLTEVDRSVPGVVTMRAVRAAGHERFDRVVFEFDGDFVPGYHVEYIDRPVRACGSGNVVELPGDGWLQVRMPDVRAHTEAGEATIENRRRRPNLPIIKGLALTCDYEAVVTWVLGVSSPNRYRVLELADPPRIAIDVRR